MKKGTKQSSKFPPKKNQERTIRFFAVYFSLFLILDPLPLYALSAPPSAQSAGAPSPGLVSGNSYAKRLSSDALPSDCMTMEWQSRGTRTRIQAESRGDFLRLHRYFEVSKKHSFFIRYLYEETEEDRVTLLYGFQDSKDVSHYSIFELSPAGSLGRLLEEGWVKDDYLIPGRIYTYFFGRTYLHTLDRTGKLLKIEAQQEGWTREFIYGRSSLLLAVKDTNPRGESRYYDQIQKRKDHLNPVSSPFDRDAVSMIQTGKGKEVLKKITASRFSLISDPSASRVLTDRFFGSLLVWMNTAIPARAGPKGAVIK